MWSYVSLDSGLVCVFFEHQSDGLLCKSVSPVVYEKKPAFFDRCFIFFVVLLQHTGLYDNY